MEAEAFTSSRHSEQRQMGARRRRSGVHEPDPGWRLPGPPPPPSWVTVEILGTTGVIAVSKIRGRLILEPDLSQRESGWGLGWLFFFFFPFLIFSFLLVNISCTEDNTTKGC